ncbi:TetR/AcrR family transcriptional regulator [Oceanobacillus jeddahense]|uniref:TetR/AcrR family transcriptional regulator n=1 Tax=Oceanobacillus jeddahense TaxID=1462527 RepID=A0ABY5JVN8_9BACI|nr:TetR/AcrR family transcriptional regulator [Oceanobacillus jeddahense]UUI04445.1 TetR/AcrR family transcriptional regulator [Oceanobacillus jeddahense]
MNSTRKEIQTARMWRYFLDAASDLIEEKGLHQITVRQIADRAGYTSSTVYNYFRDLSHLKFFAVMRYTNSYFKDLPLYMDKGINTIDKWLYAWECFCRHSFQHPEIYSLLYIENLGNIPEELVKNYYQVYANELIDLSDSVQSIISQHDIATRSSLYIQNAKEEGFLEENDIEYIADTTMLIWTGMLTNVLNLRREISNEEAAKQTMHYIQRSILQTVLPEKRNELTYQYGAII